MNRDQQLALIRQRCIVEANPEIEEVIGGDGDPFGNGGPITQGRPIRLADVLLAINEMHTTGASLKWPGIILSWNLRKDDLTEQSDECITF